MDKDEIEKLLSEKSQNGQPLVLVVEDNPTQQKLYHLIASKLEASIYVAPTCMKAVQATELLAFDIILMDIQMSGMDGLECARKIQELDRRRNRQTPIIAVTGYATPEDKERFLQAGMDDYLAKPFTINELREKIAIWSGRQRPELGTVTASV